MSFAELAVKPAHVIAEEQFGPWLAELAGRLLNATDFIVNGVAYRLAELEAYYHGPGHLDPFAHRDPVQIENGRWYFHRTGGVYRGGSFKGLDFTFGDGTAHFGVLIRTVVAPDGTVIDGPSVTVDHLLSQTKTKSVAELDKLIGTRRVWDRSAPLSVAAAKPTREAAVYRTSRVGLSLRKAKGVPAAARFVGRPYRYLTEPKAISKGKVHLVLALYHRGEPAVAISRLTGSPLKAVRRYVADFEAGKAVADFDGYIGRDLGTAELCKLLGTWAAKHGDVTGR
jgi:hypothetical protein